LSELYLQGHLRVHKTAGAHDFFRSQADQYRHQLEDAQARLSDFRRQHNVILLPEQKDLMLRRVMETQNAVNEVSASLQEAESRVRTLKTQIVPLDARVITQSRVLPNQYSIERLHTMLAELQNRRTDLLAKFRPDDRLVREVDDQIRDTNAAMERAGKLTSVEQTTDVNPLRQSLEAELARAELTHVGLVSRANILAGALRSWRIRLAQLDDVTSEHDVLNRKIKESEENLILYSKKQEESRIEDSLDQLKIANVSILEPPVTPTLPSKPNVPLNLGVGLLLAAIVSVGTAFALEMNRTTFETLDELEAAADVPVIAIIPVEGV
jgi:polysaccharide biosynthesis protein PslE